MPISNSYPKGIPIEDQDLFVGTKAYNNRTVNYSAQSVADYLNINSKVAIGGQMSFQFVTVPNVAKTIAFDGGGGDNTAFSAITKLIVSAVDASTANITIFLNYLNNSQILLSEQNQPNFFGHYKITGYTQIGTSAFYELDLEFIGGNGTIGDKQYYDLVSFVLSTEVPIPTLQSVTDVGNTTTNDIIVSKATGTSFIQVANNNNALTLQVDSTFGSLIELNDSNNNNYGSLSCGELLMTSGNSSQNVQLNSNYLSIQSGNVKPSILLSGTDFTLTGSVTIKTDLIDDDYIQQLPSASGTIALTSDITTPTLQEVTDALLVDGYAETTNPIVVGNTIDGGAFLSTDFTGVASLSGGFSEGYGVDSNGFRIDNNDGVTQFSSFIKQPIGTPAASYVWELPNASGTLALTSDIPAAGVTSVGLTMPSAFTVTNSPITSSGDIAVTGAGLVSQYVRGDGTLANFPASTGGGASLSFYLNGSVSQGTFDGVAFREMDRTPILGAGTDFTINADGYIQSFITDANVPNLLEIPAGNWNFETYFSASSGGGSPSFYVELYKWNGTTLSLIASNSASPRLITDGTNIEAYFSALAVPQTTLLATDRLAVRIYVNHSGRTITLHTEDNHLCQVITTFSTGITALNGLTQQVQFFNVGTGATNFNISSSSNTHTFNLLFNIRRNANNSSNNNINYNGYAVTGSAESSAVWTITRLTIAASGSITVATATNVAWTNRESATYT